MKAIFNIILSAFIILLIVISCKKNEDGYANFKANPTSTLVGTDIQFTDQSVNSPKAWQWDFGDGSTSNVQNPSHTYNSSGTFTVALTVSYSYGDNTRTKNNYITILSTIPILTTNTITNINQTTATGGGNVTSNGGAALIAEGVCWSTSQNPTIANSHTNDGTFTGNFMSNISGLTVNTIYYVRAYATNSVGTAYGNQVSFTTSVAVLPVLTTTAVTNITQTTATSGGNVTSNGGVSLTAEGVCWSINQNPTIANSKTNDGTGTGSFTSNITGLTVNTVYYVRAYTTNRVGTAYGSQVSFTTSLAILPVLTTTGITNITQTTATGGGNVTSNGGVAITAEGVCWSTGQNPTIANSTTNNGTGTGSFTSSITGLTANTIYYVRAYATNSVGTVYGNQVSFTTSLLTKPVLTTTAITNITSNTATGGGNVTNNGGAALSAEGVCWGTGQNPTIANSHTNDGTGIGSFTSSITGLTANTNYYVRAYATNSVGTAYGNQVSFNSSGNCGTVTDYDGNIYNAITIGTQCWIQSNLRVVHYLNGDSINHITNGTSWDNLTTGAWCNYNNSTSNETTYGHLYNWYTVNDIRGLCPSGWHVPSYGEWHTLIVYLGDSLVAGGALKSTSTFWKSPNTGATNSSGFTALPGGNRDYPNGTFVNLGYIGFLWSATEANAPNARYCAIYYDSSDANLGYFNNTAGFSVRCVNGSKK